MKEDRIIEHFFDEETCVEIKEKHFQRENSTRKSCWYCKHEKELKSGFVYCDLTNCVLGINRPGKISFGGCFFWKSKGE